MKEEQITVFEARTGNTAGRMWVGQERFELVPTPDNGRVIGLIYPKTKYQEEILLNSPQFKSGAIVIKGEPPKKTEAEVVVESLTPEQKTHPYFKLFSEEQEKDICNTLTDKHWGLIRQNILDLVDDIKVGMQPVENEKKMLMTEVIVGDEIEIPESMKIENLEEETKEVLEEAVTKEPETVVTKEPETKIPTLEEANYADMKALYEKREGKKAKFGISKEELYKLIYN
jgi:hypothetical protein